MEFLFINQHKKVYEFGHQQNRASQKLSGFSKKLIVSESRALTFKKIFVKLKFSLVLFEKIPSFVCLEFKIENKLILKLQNLFS